MSGVLGVGGVRRSVLGDSVKVIVLCHSDVIFLMFGVSVW